MSDSHHYFLAHAREAILRARRLPRGRLKAKQRVVARVYHLLAKEAAYAPNLHHIDDFRRAREVEDGVGVQQGLSLSGASHGEPIRRRNQGARL